MDNYVAPLLLLNFGPLTEQYPDKSLEHRDLRYFGKRQNLPRFNENVGFGPVKLL